MRILFSKQDETIKLLILLAKIAKKGKPNTPRPSGWFPKLGAKVIHQHYRYTE
jgi:hypothetical protein